MPGFARRGQRRTLRGVLSEALRAAQTSPPTFPDPRYHVQFSRTAMACQFEVLIRPEDRAFVSAVVGAFDLVEALEQQMSVYRGDSEVSSINAAAAAGPVQVEAGLYGLLKSSREIGAETGGAFDITTGALIRAWGFLGRQGAVPEPERLAAARTCSGWQNVDMDDDARTVSFRRPGVEINLGAIGKGFALDRLAASLSEAGLRNYLVHAGHSSIVARGDSASGPGWTVSIRRPGGGSFGSLTLRDQAVSTSSAATRFFESGDRRYGHILDPRSGEPASRNALCSVVAPSAAKAEALSTAFFVMNRDEVARYFDDHDGIGIILSALSEDGSPGAPFALGADLTGTEEVR
jgi:FAD:protein FMN transferase